MHGDDADGTDNLSTPTTTTTTTMEYERIQNQPVVMSHQGGGRGGGGLSPAKLRAMLMGGAAGKKKNDEVELEGVRFCFRSNSGSEIDSRRESTSEESRDADPASGQASTSSRGRSQDEQPEAARRHVPPFSKPAPSKWDDAQKWIASPGNSRSGKAGGAPPPKNSGGQGNRLPAAKVVLEVPDDADTKRVDLGHGSVGAAYWMASKHEFEREKSITESAVIFNRNDSSNYYQCTTNFIHPPPTDISVSLIDAGTEMTPFTSLEPSRNESPVGARTPNRSPSQPSTPRRPPATSTLSDSVDCKVEQNKELSERELQTRTRKEIMFLGAKLGKTSIAEWASREEDKAASKSLCSEPHQPTKSIAEVRAAAWEEAENAKCQARFKREEIKIQAWEDHQKAKAEAEIRKLEVEVGRKRAQAYDELIKKQESIRNQAEQKLAEAEARRSQKAARTTGQAELVGKTGRIPASFFRSGFWCCCC